MSDIDIKTVNFAKVGERLKAYRLTQGLSIQEMAKRTNLRPGSIRNLEDGRQFSSLNQLWAIVNAEGLSVLWVFRGKGRFDDTSPDMLPPTLIRKRGAGLRRNEERLVAEKGQYAGDPFEFVLAVEGFKRFNNKPFPTLTEIFELVLSLGYRKVGHPTINPCKAWSENEHPKNKSNTTGPIREIVGAGS